MIDCLILGDSIAVGIGSTLPQCKTIARVGINSKNFVVHNKYIPQSDTTIISLGSNDGNADFSKYLIQLRSKIKGKVVWILSNNNDKARKIALNIAKNNSDRVVYLSNFPSADGIHPKSYNSVSKKLL